MQKQKTILSDLICSDCGSQITISRKISGLREKYHIKDLYCVRCDKITKHIEVRNLDIVKKELEFKDDLNDIEQLVYDLTHIESDANERERVFKKVSRFI